MVAVCAQAQHMKFMGIPLDGTIDSFQAKLAAKGIKPDKQYNATTPVGSRFFEGIFCGYQAEFYAYYNAKTKNVYRCKACICNTSLNYVNRV